MKHSVALYQVLTYNKDKFYEPVYRDSFVDYFMVTNQPISSSIVKVLPIRKGDPVNLGYPKLSRYYRMLPYNIPELMGYKITIYVDAYTQQVSSLLPLVKEIEEAPEALGLCKHLRGGIVAEAEAIIQRHKDRPVVVRKQLEQYLRNGYPADSKDLYCGGLLVRKMNDLKVKEFSFAVWEEIKKGSYRNQLAIPYVLWQLNTPLHIFNSIKYEYWDSSFSSIFIRHSHIHT